MNRITDVLLVSVWFLSGCASLPTASPSAVREVIAASYAVTWAATLTTLRQRTLAVTVNDIQTGVIETNAVEFVNGGETVAEVKRVASFPPSFAAKWNRGRYSLHVFLKATEDGRTAVKVRASVTAFSHSWSRWGNCTSKGVLERELIQAIRTRLGV